MNMQPIIDHLRTNLPDLTTMGGAAEPDVATGKSAAFVIEERCDATPDSREWCLSTESVVAVYLVVKQSGDLSGEKSAAAMAELRQSIVALLHGHQPAEASSALRYIGGGITDFSPGTLWWVERFTVQHTKRN